MAHSTHQRLSDSSTGSAKTDSTAPTEFSLASSPEAIELEAKQFTSVQRLYNEVRSCDEDCLTYSGISEDIYTQIEGWRDRSGSKSRLFYLAELRVLIITIPTVAHEKLHADIHDEVKAEIQDMGLRYAWNNKGAGRLAFGGSRGEGDSTGGPSDTRGKGSDWPTLVIEAGKSQSWPSLRLKMRWWFGASGGQVKIVILSKLELRHRRMILEKWVLGPQRIRTGATTTRIFAATQYEPLLRQTITITRPADSPNQASQFVVEGAPLILEFGLLFLRPPSTNEGDIQIQDQAFRLWAVRVWDSLD